MVNRALCLASVFVFATSLVFGQTLADAAKKEKERRDALKGKSTVAVTNEDLAKVKLKPAVDIPKNEAPREGEALPLPGEGVDPATLAPGSKPGAVANPGAPLGESQQQYDSKKLELQGKLNSAQELLDLLNLKTQSLWQQFYTFNSMTSKDKIQKEIADTTLKMQATAADQARVKDELSRLSAQAPPTIIK